MGYNTMTARLLSITQLVARSYRSSSISWQRNLSRRPSYWHNPGTEPLSPLTMGQVMDHAADCWGDREALVSQHQGQRFTFHQIRQRVDRLAAGFIEMGLRPGDRLGIWGPNSSEWYFTNLAAARAGLILVTINPVYQSSELLYCLNKVGVKALVAPKAFKTQNYHEIIMGLAPELVTASPGQLCSKQLPHLQSLIIISEEYLPGAFRYEDVANAETTESLDQIQKLQSKIQPDDGCNIQFTSGTTGNPKGTLLSHHNVVNNSFLIGKRFKFGLKEHRVCLLVPLFHCFGNTVGALTAMHYGSAIVMPSGSFKAEPSLKAIQEEKCNVVYGTPTMYVDLISTARKLGVTIPSIELALSSGAPCSKQLFSDMLSDLGVQQITAVYGMTETSPVMFQCSLEDSTETVFTSVGFVGDHMEAKVVDEHGRMVPMGSPGELWVRGYLTMLGYWQDEEKTRETIGQDRWLRTGDQFVLREDGYGSVVGRLKDMIIRGGENIFPKEIEDFLQTHPDVLDAQVFGVPDERMGEEIYACIRQSDNSTLTEDDLKNYCKGKISHFKIPRYIQFVADFPKTATGKIQKFLLRKMIMNESGVK